MPEAAYSLALTMRVVAGGDYPVPWGAAADARQRADMHALLAEHEVNQHVWQRARGYMKTTDSAVAAVATLLTDAPEHAVLQVFANDQEQAGKIMLAVRTIVAHLPDAAAGQLKTTSSSVTNVVTGASIRVETSDAASSLGASPYMLILDEFANWRDTRTFVQLWDNTYSGLPKTGNARILIVTSAGPIGTWPYERLATFRRSRHWRYSEAPGKAPWRSEEDLAKQREGMSSQAAFRMFHLNQFTSAEDALVSEDDLAAAVSDGLRERPYDPSHAYVVAVDIGVKHDATAVTVCHREGGRVVQDAHRRYLPRIGRKVDLQAVRAELLALHASYGQAPVVADASQAHLMAQELREAGVPVTADQITVAYNHACAAALQSAFEQRRVDLLDLKEQTDELLTVVVRVRTSGGAATLSLDSSGSNHDDQADVLAMATEYLMSRPYFGAPAVSNAEDLARTRAVERSYTGELRRGSALGAGAAGRGAARAARRAFMRAPAADGSAYGRFRARFGWGTEVAGDEPVPWLPPAADEPPEVIHVEGIGSTQPTGAPVPPQG